MILWDQTNYLIKYLHGFTLDRVIAMGFPSENVESIYRNSLDEVRKLLEEKHKVNRIFNLHFICVLEDNCWGSSGQTGLIISEWRKLWNVFQRIIK